jgi:histidyl-tRNA synthetase
MLKPIQSIRGMNDILPGDSALWNSVRHVLKTIVESYGYAEIVLPIVEETDLFQRSMGESTDVVQKEMYTFTDRAGESLTLRPEGTAGCVRAGIEHGLFYNQQQKFWYFGPMFRYERPQKGRYRQFYQFGVEAFGMEGPDVDAEMLLMIARLFKSLGLLEQVSLQLNSLGSAEARKHYREKLVDYFSAHYDQLDEDSQKRLQLNPLRILDSKDEKTQLLVKDAPRLWDFLSEEDRQHFETLCRHLDKAGLKYEINPCLVRGLDYYTKTVFEWVTDQLGSQGAVCGGGRFDLLVEYMGGGHTPAIGFSFGVERLLELLKHLNQLPALDVDPHIYLLLMGEPAKLEGLALAENIRNELPALRVLMNCDSTSLKSQFKKADKSGAKIALILGEEELTSHTVVIKYLREERAQEKVFITQLISMLRLYFNL